MKSIPPLLQFQTKSLKKQKNKPKVRILYYSSIVVAMRCSPVVIAQLHATSIELYALSARESERDEISKKKQREVLQKHLSVARGQEKSDCSIARCGLYVHNTRGVCPRAFARCCCEQSGLLQHQQQHVCVVLPLPSYHGGAVFSPLRLLLDAIAVYTI